MNSSDGVDFVNFMEEAFGGAIAEPDDVVDVTKMSTEELMDLISDITDELFNAGQAINPQAQWARDKHSLRNAVQIELRKRSK